MKSRDQIIAENPLDRVMREAGVVFIGDGRSPSAKCPFHKDGRASLSINLDKGLWNCHACDIGGSVIDFIARRDNKTAVEVLKELGGNGTNGHERPPSEHSKIVATYDYTDESGRLLYQACRMEPKDFRQRQPNGKGGWEWHMKGVRRVLYGLPRILKSKVDTVWIVEGEKDCLNLIKLGLSATTNVGGAGKWMDAYSPLFTGKEVVLCPDNDTPGMKHMDQVLESVAPLAKIVRKVTVPKPHKDISDYVATFAEPEQAFNAVQTMIDDATVFTKGISIPVYGMKELEARYRREVNRAATHSLDLAQWLPSFGGYVRPLIPGEMVLIVADTGVGKTAILQNIARCANPLKTLLFELELPDTLTYERFVAMATNKEGALVYDAYKTGNRIAWEQTGELDHIFVCPKPRMSPAAMSNIIIQSELIIGERPAVAMLDYAQLADGGGDGRRESVSNVAEGMKALAKDTNIIVIVASQVARKKETDPEIFLHDAKESGSLENSSGLVLGAWIASNGLMNIKVLKNTKGRPGRLIECDFEGAKTRITEHPKIETADMQTGFKI